MKCFDKAISINPEDAGAWGGKGVALVGMGKTQDAINACDKALFFAQKQGLSDLEKIIRDKLNSLKKVSSEQ